MPSRWKVPRNRFSLSPASRTAAGSGTRFKMGIEKSAHQIATLRNDRREAISTLGMPNHPGFMIQARLISSSNPPPMYPRAQPLLETWSTSSRVATWGKRESEKIVLPENPKCPMMYRIMASNQSPVLTKNSSAVVMMPTAAKRLSSIFFLPLWSARAPRMGAAMATRTIEMLLA